MKSVLDWFIEDECYVGMLKVFEKVLGDPGMQLVPVEFNEFEVVIDRERGTVRLEMLYADGVQYVAIEDLLERIRRAECAFGRRGPRDVW